MKVLKVTLPDGQEYWAESTKENLMGAKKGTIKYLKDHNIPSSQRPLTSYTELDIPKESYIHGRPGSQEANDFFDGTENPKPTEPPDKIPDNGFFMSKNCDAKGNPL